MNMEILFDVFRDWDMLLRPQDIWKLCYYSVAKFLWKPNYVSFLSYWRRSTSNLVFIYWFNAKYCMWDLRVLHLSLNQIDEVPYEYIMFEK